MAQVDTNIDFDRARRCGQPEAIFAQGKTPEQVARIARDLYAAGNTVLATRATPEHHAAVAAVLPTARYHDTARLIVVARQTDTGAGTHSPESAESAAPTKTGAEPAAARTIVVATAGTSDLPVAEEAALTAETYGAPVMRLYDIGVAGVHRALAHTDRLEAAGVVIAVAGMEGALPSLIAGLTACPVVAVPTSVGYGAHFQGLAALLTMLNSCAAGIGVVNIDNGYGAAMLALKILGVRS
ncbi:MAG: nickel pincer cofactor biosynthesis protein LarB [Actinomycetes bacterium]|jgi:NCAIR mutase (PurE)-related protein|nr:nickel pincer cofactor biosynthesis protein LarB [Actinomycetes bacterium]